MSAFDKFLLSVSCQAKDLGVAGEAEGNQLFLGELTNSRSKRIDEKACQALALFQPKDAVLHL